jgi:PERQ amino acid-rich with GYF domain-containing protein
MNASRNGATHDHRYTKEQLLQLFKGQEDLGNTSPSLSELFMGGWEPNIANGSSSASWGRREENRDSHGADLCWDRDAQMFPMGLQDMTEEEKDVCAGCNYSHSAG